jgi:small-conductance mechanosensitive channel
LGKLPRAILIILFSLIISGSYLSVSSAGEAPEKETQDIAPLKLLTDPPNQVVPLETEKILEVAEKLGSELEIAGKKASSHYGNWLDAEVFLGISWLKLLVCMGLMGLTLLMERLAHFWIKSNLRRLQKREESSSLRYLSLQSFARPLSLFILMYGSYFSLSPLFIHFRSSHKTNLVQSVASKAADLGGMIAAAWFAYSVFRVVEQRIINTKYSPGGVAGSCIKHCRGPVRLLVSLFLIRLIIPFVESVPELHSGLVNSVSILIIGSISWMLIGAANVVEELILRNHKIDVKDNLTARRIHTQIHYIKRVIVFGIIVISVASGLMLFDKVRQFGAGLLASAGIAGIVVGLAAQRSLANLLTGLQIAITQPIRIDDVVVLENEFGRIEEITSTYAVARLWDSRRLIVPLTYFTEKPFQNWTRTSSDVLGAVYIYTDYSVSIESLRIALHDILSSSRYWDGQVGLLQVTDSKEHCMEIRALASASDASSLWDLRCEVREKLIAFIQENFHDSLPRVRVVFDAPGTVVDHQFKDHESFNRQTSLP